MARSSQLMNCANLCWHFIADKEKEANMGFLKVLADKVIDIKPQLKLKKADDKQQKKEGLVPDFSKARMRIQTSSAYAGGYELVATLPIAADFLKKDKDGMNKFIEMLHKHINESLGKWMGKPTIGGLNDRAKNGMLTISAHWYFQDPILAYSLGLNLAEWHGSGEVVDRGQIETRKEKAEKAMREMDSFRELAGKKLKLRSKDAEERNKIWKDEFMGEWSKLSDKWQEQGISYSAIKSNQKSSAFGYAARIQSHYAPKLTEEQAAELKKEIVKDGHPVRFLYSGEALDIMTGKTAGRGTNVIYHPVYWNFTKDTAKKIAKWLNVKPVFDQGE